MGNETVEMKVEETDLRPNMKRNSKTHHEELVTPTPCAEKSDAVVEWFRRWNAATAPKRRTLKLVAVVSGFEANIDPPDNVDVQCVGSKSRRYDGS